MRETRKKSEERRVLDTLQWIAAGVTIFLLIFLVIADVVGRLYIDPNFHVSEVIFGTLGGILLVLLGLRGLDQVVKRHNGNGHKDAE